LCDRDAPFCPIAITRRTQLEADDACCVDLHDAVEDRLADDSLRHAHDLLRALGAGSLSALRRAAMNSVMRRA
jgi:hypothetical protein